jgi:hypothetical protein
VFTADQVSGETRVFLRLGGQYYETSVRPSVFASVFDHAVMPAPGGAPGGSSPVVVTAVGTGGTIIGTTLEETLFASDFERGDLSDWSSWVP